MLVRYAGDTSKRHQARCEVWFVGYLLQLFGSSILEQAQPGDDCGGLHQGGVSSAQHSSPFAASNVGTSELYVVDAAGGSLLFTTHTSAVRRRAIPRDSEMLPRPTNGYRKVGDAVVEGFARFKPSPFEKKTSFFPGKKRSWQCSKTRGLFPFFYTLLTAGKRGAFQNVQEFVRVGDG